MTDEVLVERAENLLVITLNRSHVRNAVDTAMSVALANAVDELDADDALTVSILTGTGSTFCAGMDLKAFLRGELPAVAGRGFGGLGAACQTPDRHGGPHTGRTHHRSPWNTR